MSEGVMATDLTTTPTADLAADLAAISAGSPETLATIRMRYQAQVQRKREELAAIDAAILEHIEANGGRPIRVSDELEMRAVEDAEWKVRENGGKLMALNSVLANVEGDIGGVAEYLCANPFKAGAVRKLLPHAEFLYCFERHVRTRLESGAPRKRLAVVNPKILGPYQHPYLDTGFGSDELP